MGQWTTRVRVAVVAVVVALGLFVFVYPTRALLSQNDDIGRTRHDLASLQQQNHNLQHEVLKLRTREEVERIARKRFSWVRQGERLYVVVPGPSAPTTTTLPTP